MDDDLEGRTQDLAATEAPVCRNTSCFMFGDRHWHVEG